MKKISFILFLSAILMGHELKAQDIHFSQFWKAPLLQNPSNAGNAEGEIRAIVNYRSQWKSVTSNPYETFGVSYDMRFKNSQNGNFFAGGISLYSDLAGESKMRTTLANLALAYYIKLNDKSFISGGLQGGINQKSISTDDLRFDNQYDGNGHNPNLSSYENLKNLSEIKPAFSGGVSYIWSNNLRKTTVGKIDGAKKIKLGFAVHHFNSPSFSFSNAEKLGLKYISSFEGSFGSRSTPWIIQPVILFGLQNKSTDIIVGSLFKYLLNDDSHITDFRKKASIGFGAYYRFNDAIIPTIQVEFASFDIGVSYDVNLSQLSTSSSGRGGFEINLKYTSQQSTFNRKSTARFF